MIPLSDIEPVRAAKDELEIKLGIPGVLTARWQRTWNDRREEFVDQVAAASGLTLQEIGQRVSGDEPFGDVFWQAMDRAAQVSDHDYLSALGRLVAGALDEAQVDEVALLTAELVRLEPLHLRVLLTAFSFRKNAVNPNEPAPIAKPTEADWATTSAIAVFTRHDSTTVLERAAAQRLAASGFVEEDREIAATSSLHRPITQRWLPTAWGYRAIRLLSRTLATSMRHPLPGRPQDVSTRTSTGMTVYLTGTAGCQARGGVQALLAQSSASSH